MDSFFDRISLAKATRALTHLRVPLAYLVLAYVFHAIDVNILRIALAPGDGAVHGVPSKIYGAEFSLWNPYILSGVSRLATQGFQTLYWPGILIMKAFPSEFGYNVNLLLHYALAGYFTFLFVRRLGPGAAAAFVSGVCFMFSGFMSSHKGHHMMVNAATWLPLVLYFVERFIQNPKRLHWLFLGSAAYAMTFYADYLAVPMYTAMVVAPYVAFRMMATGQGSRFRRATRSMAAIMATLGIGMVFAAPYILPIVESVSRVTRERISYDTFSSYSFPVLALPMLLFPYVFGTHSTGFYRSSYFGPWNMTEVAGYVGLTPIVVAAVAFFSMRKRNRQVWFWAVVVLAGSVLVLGYQTPLHRLLYHVPVYNMFRAPARNWLEVHFAVAVLVGFGLDLIEQHAGYLTTASRLFKRCWGAVAAVAVSTAILLQLGSGFLPHTMLGRLGVVLPWASNLPVTASELPVRTMQTWSFAVPNIYIPVIVLFSGIVATWVAFRLNAARSRRVLVMGTAIFADLFSFGHFHDSNYELSATAQAATKNEVSEWLRHDPSAPDYRILPFESMQPHELFPNVNLRLHVATVNGYGAVLLKDYASLLSLEADGTMGHSSSLVRNNAVLSSLGARYLITKSLPMKVLIENAGRADRCESHWPDSPVQSHRDHMRVAPTYEKLLETSQGVALYRNNRALPVVRLAESIRCVGDFLQAKAILESRSPCDLSTATVVECGSQILASASVRGGQLKDVTHSADRWLLTADTEGDALVVIGQSHYPGWEARVDGKRTALLKADGVLQAVWIPTAGRHRIELQFNPFSFRLGLWLMAFGLGAAGVALLLVRRGDGRGRG